jgi:hypothetical protein
VGSLGHVNIRVPNTTADGTYYLLACADGLAQVNEANELDNCRASVNTTSVTHGLAPTEQRTMRS